MPAAPDPSSAEAQITAMRKVRLLPSCGKSARTYHARGQLEFSSRW